MSNQSYFMTLGQQPVLKVPGISYLSCRGPDENYVLVAQCENDELGYQLSGLEARWRKVIKELGYVDDSCFGPDDYSCRRNCDTLCFLPHTTRLLTNTGLVTYALPYKCFKIDNMVRARDLVKYYYVSPFTAYRLAVSLLTLVDWYIRMSISDNLLINNLLVDLTTSYMIPIDWSKTQILEYPPSQLRVKYYCQFAHIMLRLVGARRTKNGWEFPPEYQDKRYREFLDILREVYSQIYDPPTGQLVEAINYEEQLREQQENLIKRLIGSLRYSKEDAGKPSYEVLSKK